MAAVLVLLLHACVLWLGLHGAKRIAAGAPPRVLQLVMLEHARPVPAQAAPRPPAVRLRPTRGTRAAPAPAPALRAIAFAPAAGSTLAAAPVQAGSPALPMAQPAAATPEPARAAAYLLNPVPDYPPLSRQLHEQGLVLLRVEVGADGQPGQVELHQSSGFARLDAAALDAVRRWRFVPARRAGAPVADWIVVPLRFSLAG